MNEVIDNMYFIESVIIKTENEDVNTLSLYYQNHTTDCTMKDIFLYIQASLL